MSEHSASPYTDSQVLARFWAKVNKGKEDECWLWTASTRNKGYGAFCYNISRKMIQDRAHRFSYIVHVGAIPQGLFVLHRCDTPACVNPAHLFLGTIADNNRDMVRKGRHVKAGTHRPVEQCNYMRGINHCFARLTPEIIVSIRHDREQGLSYSALARKYGIGIKHAWHIVKRKVWKHVD